MKGRRLPQSFARLRMSGRSWSLNSVHRVPSCAIIPPNQKKVGWGTLRMIAWATRHPRVRPVASHPPKKSSSPPLVPDLMG